MTQLASVTEMLQTLMSAQFYGELLIKFENGHIIVLKKTESIKLEEVGGINSS